MSKTAEILKTIVVLAFALVVLALTFGCATKPAPKQEPRTPMVFYSGVSLYVNKHPVGLLVSKDRFLTCRDALEDTHSALAKLLDDGNESHSAVGLCIPVPVYDAADLVPESLF